MYGKEPTVRQEDLILKRRSSRSDLLGRNVNLKERGSLEYRRTVVLNLSSDKEQFGSSQ